MRKVNEQTVSAVLGGKPFRGNNTHASETEVLLHGSRIVWRDGDDVRASLCGWNTTTTRSRINSVLEALGIPFRFVQRKGIARIVGPHLDCSITAKDVVRMFQSVKGEWQAEYVK